MEYADAPAKVVTRLGKICLALPDAYEEKAWAGTRWCVRKKNFAHVLTVTDDQSNERVLMIFRSVPPELEALQNAGHPFFALGWGRNVIGLVIDAKTDWKELAELVADSFCVMAPKKLSALVNGASD